MFEQVITTKKGKKVVIIKDTDLKHYKDNKDFVDFHKKMLSSLPEVLSKVIDESYPFPKLRVRLESGKNTKLREIVSLGFFFKLNTSKADTISLAYVDPDEMDLIHFVLDAMYISFVRTYGKDYKTFF